ncbi:hypothetical protein SII_0828 [Streptococcus intermedius C270]|nr:hypothetical protein SII_0828 [Streptococcus intermedius C270]
MCGYLQFTPMKRYEFFCCTYSYNLSYKKLLDLPRSEIKSH